MIFKFVKWDIPPLNTLKFEKVYELHEKMEKGKELTREEKNWLVKNMNSLQGIRLHGYEFNFFKLLKGFYVEQYGSIHKQYAPDKTSIRSNSFGKITRITEFS